MKQICGLCKSDLNKKQASGPCITGGICSECAQKFRLASGAEILKEIIETIDAPILLMQAEPRQVYTANSKALGLFNKELAQIAGHR
ncbi:MAG: hypothetical protein HY885_01640, partial [Deltaproteobacteria bacterium]|nr:hypothetical protein [Deltaproteobacteria bacterium]